MSLKNDKAGINRLAAVRGPDREVVRDWEKIAVLVWAPRYALQVLLGIFCVSATPDFQNTSRKCHR